MRYACVLCETRKAAMSEATPPQPPKQDVEADNDDAASTASADDNERTLKVVVCGDGASGKTSLCTRFAQDGFEKTYHQTLGLDFFSRRLQLPSGVSVLLQVWDIGGQSIAGEMIEKYVYGCHIALIVYDVTNSASFEDVQDWLSVVRRVTEKQEELPLLVLVGNKTDLEHKRTIRIDRHKKFAEEQGMESHYCSAKTGDTVTLMFKSATASYLKIPLAKVDLEGDIVITEGEVSREPEPVKSRRAPDQAKNTAVCNVQ